MKKTILIFLFLSFVGSGYVAAQNEQTSDSINLVLSDNIRLLGDFMLDMNILMPPKLPEFNADPLNSALPKDYNALFQLPGSSTYSKGYMQNSGLMYGYGFFSSPDYMYGASFKLNDKVSLNTYGQYDIYGRRMPDTNALPWEKNNFKSAMELKFNKNFGIRIEVEQRRNTFPY